MIDLLESIFIKNYKAFEKDTFVFEKDNLLIGENDSGKSTILQALDVFFNQEKVDKIFVRNQNENVKIGIMFNGKYYFKEYSGTSYKVSNQSDNISDLEGIKYIYIPASTYDVKKLITQLAVAKALSMTDEETINKLKEISNCAVSEVLSTIDKDLIVVDNTKTEIEGKEDLKYDKALSFVVNSNGIPIESRGSGYQKNLMYALLIGNTYENVILGIDEIENSLSINNAQRIINELQNKMGQTLLSTHSKRIMETIGNSIVNIIPLYTNNDKSLYELLDALDSADKKVFIIVEGKYDLPWYKKVVTLLNKNDKYIVLPGGGSSDIKVLKNELEKLGKKCICISDGDTYEQYKISKDCIELYTPLDDLNNILNINLSKVPENKLDFFNEPITNKERNENNVKRLLSSKVNVFLREDNPLVDEINKLLENAKMWLIDVKIIVSE